MMGYEEKQKLLREFHSEPARGISVVIKCAACLLIIAGIAAIGAPADLQPEAAEVASADAVSAHEE